VGSAHLRTRTYTPPDNRGMPTPGIAATTPGHQHTPAQFNVGDVSTARVDGASAIVDAGQSTNDPAATFDGSGGQAGALGGGPVGGANALNVRLQADLPAGYSLPKSAPLAAATIHRYDDPRVNPPTIAVTIWAPLPPAGSTAKVENLNTADIDAKLPDRFILTDAGLTRCFIGVDKREGTPLAEKLDAIVAQIPTQPDGTIAAEDAIEFCRSKVNSLIKWTAGSSANDGRAEFAWDKAIDVPDSVWDTFKNVAFHDVGHAPEAAGVDYPVVPFENYLDEGQGYCLQKAVLAALILDKVGVPSRLVNGAVGQGAGRAVGHSWVELGDGRVLDAAWGDLKPKGPAHADMPDRYKFGWSYRFNNQAFPYLVFD
jgi:hypothetical protein